MTCHCTPELPVPAESVLFQKIRDCMEEIERSCDALDFLTDTHPHTGARKLMVALNNHFMSIVSDLEAALQNPTPRND
jgi:hypothetical protein